jgi:hypothetical protein
MLYFILLFWYSFADISQVPFCPTNVYEELKSETPVPGNKACEDAIAQSPNSDRWCNFPKNKKKEAFWSVLVTWFWVFLTRTKIVEFRKTIFFR